jgi:hypothetical protein
MDSLKPLAVLMTALLSFAAAASEDSDKSADVAHCGAVYRVSAATAVDEQARKAFAANQAKMDGITADTFGSMAPMIDNAASQSLVEMMKEGRARDEQNGAAKVLETRQAFCSSLLESLSK